MSRRYGVTAAAPSGECRSPRVGLPDVARRRWRRFVHDATEALMTALPRALQTLVGRYDATAFEPAGGRARVRLSITDGAAWDAVLADGGARLVPAEGG